MEPRFVYLLTSCTMALIPLHHSSLHSVLHPLHPVYIPNRLRLPIINPDTSHSMRILRPPRSHRQQQRRHARTPLQRRSHHHHIHTRNHHPPLLLLHILHATGTNRGNQHEHVQNRTNENPRGNGLPSQRIRAGSHGIQRGLWGRTPLPIVALAASPSR